MSTAVATFLSLLFFVGGILLFGYFEFFVGFEGYAFAAGILAVSIALAIPVHLMKRVG